VRLQGYRENHWVLFGFWSNLPKSSDPVYSILHSRKAAQWAAFLVVKCNSVIVLRACSSYSSLAG